MRVRWTTPALRDLEEIGDFIAPYRVRGDELPILAVFHGARTRGKPGAPSPLAGEGVGRRPTDEGDRAERDGFAQRLPLC